MISQEEALHRILARVRPRPSRAVPLAEALDRFAVAEVMAAVSLPPFDNSAMDGYAVVASSCAVGTRLKLIGEQPAGADRNLIVRAGEAIRIFTGAPMPSGADAVIMQEDVTLDEGDVIVGAQPDFGEFVRPRGGDVAAGQKLIAAGDRLRPQMLALLASQGFETAEIGGEVRVAILSTGDELATPGAKLQPGQIYNSNSVLLQALASKAGANVVSVTHCPDRADAVEAAIRAGLEQHVLIITGGVSVGARDLVKPALTSAGVALDLWRVAVKPGKPFLYGHAGDCAIFGLPGNPVSAFVTFLLFVRPALLRLMGANDASLALPKTEARLTSPLHNDGRRPHYVRGILDNGCFTPTGLQESHALFGLSRANGLVLVQPNEEIALDAQIHVFTWD